jgi:hypothetical protein
MNSNIRFHPKLIEITFTYEFTCPFLPKTVSGSDERKRAI